jgi:DNA-binding Lrp family transcriptional regulator
MKVNIALFICCIIAIFYAYTKHMQAGEARPNDTLVVHDTSWQKYDSIVEKTKVVYKEIRVDVMSKPEMLPDTNYDNLKRQYMALLQLYMNKLIYSDTIRVGTYGYIAVLDTINENKLKYRRTRDNYSIPIVKETKTITKYAPPTRNVFVGAGVLVNNALGIRGAEAGMILKTKKDQLYNIKASVDIDGNVMYGAGYYYKLK